MPAMPGLDVEAGHAARPFMQRLNVDTPTKQSFLVVAPVMPTAPTAMLMSPASPDLIRGLAAGAYLDAAV